jgi:hypothetical protein
VSRPLPVTVFAVVHTHGRTHSRREPYVKQEKIFFEKLAGAISPGWTVSLSSQAVQPGTMGLGCAEVRLYLVDTSNGWTVAGSMAEEGFDQAREAVLSAGLDTTDLLDAAGQAIADMSRRQAKADDEELHRVFCLVAAALTGTQTFQAVPKHKRHGHWLYLAYRGYDASTVCRPLFFGDSEAGFCSPEVLTQVARQVIAHDLREGTMVSKALRRAGGALIAADYRV